MEPRLEHLEAQNKEIGLTLKEVSKELHEAVRELARLTEKLGSFNHMLETQTMTLTGVENRLTKHDDRLHQQEMDLRVLNEKFSSLIAESEKKATNNRNLIIMILTFTSIGFVILGFIINNLRLR